MRCSTLFTAVILPLFTAASSLRALGTCGGVYGPCEPGSYCRTGACSTDESQGANCLGICLLIPADGQIVNAHPTLPVVQSGYPIGGGFQLTDNDGNGVPDVYQTQNQQGPQQQGQPAFVQQQGVPAPAPPGGSGPGFSCVNGYNSQCAQGSVCLADPRNTAITPIAICVPATRLCGGQTDAKCAGGLVCVADPRVNCNPIRGDRGCTGLCV